MARMVPDEFGIGHTDQTEQQVFSLIRDQTPDSWLGLHHVGLPRHNSKPIAEVDFIVISEAGIFCLEVKGGAVSRVDGVWHAGKRELKESPFAQVGSASAALRQQVPELQPFVYGYGCVFPHCRFEVQAPEVLSEVVYDQPCEAQDFSEYIRRLGSYWKGRYPHSSPLSTNDISRTAHALRADFTLEESVMPAVRKAKRRLISYTEEQARAVAGLREEPQVVVRGGAGTGKTVIAIQEAVRLAKAGHKTLFTCYTKAIGAHLEHSVHHPELTIAHMDSLISNLIQAGETEDQIPSDVGDEERFDLFRPLAAIAAVARLGEEGQFDALVVDEGQDLLTQPRLDVLDALIQGGIREGSWRVFWDPLQALFMPEGIADLGLLRAAGARPVTYPLGVNCRNTREIAERIEHLSGVDIEEVAFVEGPEPADAEWDNAKTQSKRLRSVINGWLAQGVPVESIAILSPRRFDASIASRPSEVGKPIRDTSGRRPEPDPNTIAFSTIQAFKGLESEAVLLVDVDDLESDRMRALLYVGASRARTVLGVLRKQSTTPTFTRRILDRSRRESATPTEAVDLF